MLSLASPTLDALPLATPHAVDLLAGYLAAGVSAGLTADSLLPAGVAVTVFAALIVSLVLAAGRRHAGALEEGAPASEESPA
ncbi:MAG: hypothetical protein JWP66_280 [Naasia sp.]|nr:hypothetical protein [Naasia sp.]